MRKKLITLTSLLIFAIAGTASASTITLGPSTVSVTKGQTFTVTVNVEPAGVKLYTIKGVVTYPADILEATAFAFAAGTPAWIPLSQSGYDSMTAGNVTKTAGFPGGFTTAKAFGTITFRAKESGVATIAVSPQSLAYDAQSKNTLTGEQGLSAVTITAPAPAPKTPTTPKAAPASAPKAEEPAVLGQGTSTAQEEPTSSQPIASQSLVATIGNALTLGTNSVAVGILVSVIILALIGYAVYALIERARRKKLGKPQ